MPDFLLPDLGEGLTEAAILNWHVDVGDTVKVDQIVVEVETAKAAVEVPVPFAGVVSALHGEPGQLLPVGAPLLSVGGSAPSRASRRRAAAERPHRARHGADDPAQARPPRRGARAEGQGARRDLAVRPETGFGQRDRPRQGHRVRRGRHHPPRRRRGGAQEASDLGRPPDSAHRDPQGRRGQAHGVPAGDPRGHGLGRRRRDRAARRPRGAQRDVRTGRSACWR